MRSQSAMQTIRNYCFQVNMVLRNYEKRRLTSLYYCFDSEQVVRAIVYTLINQLVHAISTSLQEIVCEGDIE